MPIRWILPPGRVPAHLQLSSPTFPIYLTVSALRLVARNAPVWRLVGSGNVEGVRELFVSRQASVFDITEGGGSLITVGAAFSLYHGIGVTDDCSLLVEHGNKILARGIWI